MQKRNLTKELICEVAIQLIEAHGLEALSMRKLASQLKVEAASLYNHIINKSELFDLIQEYLYSQIPEQVSNKNWKIHLFALAKNTRSGLLRVPQVAILFATRPTITSTSLKQVDNTLNILIEAGFKRSEVLSIFRNLHVFVLGHVLAEVGQVPGETNQDNESSISEINIDEYPVLKRVSSYKYNIDFEKGFKLGLQCMLDGLEKILTRKIK